MLSSTLLIVLAFVVDLLFGDPRWLPHPIRLIGWFAARIELGTRKIVANATLAGAATVITVLGGTAGVVWGLIAAAVAIHPVLGDLVKIYLLYTSFALNDLAKHSLRVYEALRHCDISVARKSVAMIVGRQTDQLDVAGISRACVETVSENLVDGVTAPLFWAVIGGPIGAMLYKAVNTMDSMFGYKNSRYLHFGLVPARLDDLCNYLPARITALTVVAVSGLLGFDRLGSWRIWRRDRLQHASPNSAQSEAAFAGALGLQLGGPNMYFGSLVDKPFIGEGLGEARAEHIPQANRLLYGAAVASLLLFVGVRLCLGWIN